MSLRMPGLAIAISTPNTRAAAVDTVEFPANRGENRLAGLLRVDAMNTMSETVTDRHGVRTLVCAPGGTMLRTDREALDVIGQALHHEAELVAIPSKRFDDAFFMLSTRVAGEIIQKFVNYRLRLAIVGDLSAHLDASSALRDFVAESNRGRQVWFVADLAEVDARLARQQVR
jgi:hypothetical protein